MTVNFKTMTHDEAIEWLLGLPDAHFPAGTMKCVAYTHDKPHRWGDAVSYPSRVIRVEFCYSDILRRALKCRWIDQYFWRWEAGPADGMHEFKIPLSEISRIQG